MKTRDSLVGGLIVAALMATGLPAVAAGGPDVGIRIDPSGDQPRISAGRGFAFNAEISFDGPATPDKVELTGTLPAGVLVVSQDAPGGGYCAADPQKVTCTSRNGLYIGPDDSWTLKVEAKVPAAYAQPTLSTTVQVRALSGGQVVGQASRTFTWALAPASPAAHQDRPELFPQSRTLQVHALPGSDAERTRTAQRQRWPDVQPTGFYLNPGEDLTVELKGNAEARLMVGTWDLFDPADPTRKERPAPASYPLRPGKNTVTDGFGGLLWIQYTAKADPITVTLGDTAQPVPYYAQGSTTGASWREMLSASKIPWAVLAGRRIMLAVALSSAQAQQNADQDALLSEYERIMNAEDAIAGLDGSKPEHQRSPLRQLIVESHSTAAGGNRFASDYHIGYPHGRYSLKELLSAEGLHNSWGLWHELGHQRQQRWTWPAVSEVTVNTFSLAAFHSDPALAGKAEHGNAAEWDQTWRWLNKPLAQRDFDCVPPTGDTNPNCRYSELFNRMTMFEQLRLAYGDAWSHRLHQLTREEQPKLDTDKAKRVYFMTTACRAAGQDLSAYFATWALPDSKDACTSLKLPEPAGDLTGVAAYGGGKVLSTSGAVKLDPPSGRYGAGVRVTATATGKMFSGWMLDGRPAGTARSITITMGTDHTLTASAPSPARVAAPPPWSGESCASPGQSQPRGTGILTCTGGLWVYEHCGPGTAAQQAPTGEVVCGRRIATRER